MGETIDDGQFDLGDDLYPGMDTREVYSFQINKNDTDLPLEYTVDLTPSGDLFPEDGSSPVDVTMEREVDGEWTEVDYTTTFEPESDTESYRILVDWPHGDNDIDFQGATGNMKLEVVATQIDPPAEPVETGEAHISLFTDKATKSNEIDFDNLSDFYLKNKETGETYSDGEVMWNRKASFEMEDIPVGEYTVHFTAPEPLYLNNILIGGSYSETDYDSDANPIVISTEEKEYVKIILTSDVVLDEIMPLEDMTFSSDITLEEFRDELPKQTTIVDSNGNEHQVDLRWDVRPFNFDGWKERGRGGITSNFFKLPLGVSNSDPAKRLEVRLSFTFE